MSLENWLSHKSEPATVGTRRVGLAVQILLRCQPKIENGEVSMFVHLSNGFVRGGPVRIRAEGALLNDEEARK